MGEDVIGSGPDRPADSGAVARRRVYRLAHRLAAMDPRRRRAAVAAVLTAAAVAALAGLRAGALEVGQPVGAGTPTRVGQPSGSAQTPTFDSRPGRTPIPAPSLVGAGGQTIGGELPVFAPAPSEAAVRIAVQLILGRFCADPAAHRIQLESDAARPWRSATAIVRPARFPPTDRPEITLRLSWTGYTYRWRGPVDQLIACA